jgi:hypothetical protein
VSKTKTDDLLVRLRAMTESANMPGCGGWSYDEEKDEYTYTVRCATSTRTIDGVWHERSHASVSTGEMETIARELEAAICHTILGGNVPVSNRFLQTHEGHDIRFCEAGDRSYHDYYDCGTDYFLTVHLSRIRCALRGKGA